MDITPTTTVLPPPLPEAKSPEPEPETPTRILPRVKPLSFSNGVLKRHHYKFPVSVAYKECLKNHAAAMGAHSVDGCGEFMPSPSATHTDPTSLKCAACGCHRNFHRREPDLDHRSIEYQPHHRTQPPAPASSSSPPPISMLLALSTRKRHRTKFSPAQKEQMFRFAERLGWKMQKHDDDLIREFCDEVNVDKGVLKVWMHNNKNTFVKRVVLDDKITNQSNGISDNNLNKNHNEDEDEDDRREHQFRLGVAGGAANGVSSSSS